MQTGRQLAVDCVCVLGLAAFVAWSAAPLFEPAYFVDDALIYLRVASNLLDGNGWTYNPGEPVNPCSSALYLLFLVGIGALGRALAGWIPAAAGAARPELWMALAQVVALQALAVLHFAAFRRRGPALAVALALVAVSGGVLRRAAGMETPLFLALVLASALAYSRQRRTLAAWLAAAVVWARPEGIALAAILLIAARITSRRLDLRLIWPSVAAFAALALFSLLTFGSPVPNSVLVKSVSHLPSSPALFFGVFLAQPSWPLVTFGIGAVGLVVAAADARRGDPYALLVSAFAALQLVAYGLASAHPGYTWYFAPANLALDLAASLGIVWAVGALLTRAAARATPTGVAPGAAHVALALLLVLAMRTLAVAPPRELQRYRFAPHYTLAARWIVRNTEPGLRVAAPEIGYVGFYSGRQIVDPFGLVHRDALVRLRADGTEWWLDERPELVVTLWAKPREDAHPRIPQARHEEFLQRYAPVYQSGPVHVWQIR
jgi:hypothetical protein